MHTLPAFAAHMSCMRADFIYALHRVRRFWSSSRACIIESAYGRVFQKGCGVPWLKRETWKQHDHKAAIVRVAARRFAFCTQLCAACVPAHGVVFVRSSCSGMSKGGAVLLPKSVPFFPMWSQARGARTMRWRACYLERDRAYAAH
eukprot:1312949-Pleurochrysis_carterae.AAC.1